MRVAVYVTGREDPFVVECGRFEYYEHGARFVAMDDQDRASAVFYAVDAFMVLEDPEAA